MKTIVDRRMIGTLVGAEECMFLVNEGHLEKVKEIPMRLTEDETVPAGTRFTKLGGDKTSAGYSPIHMNEGCYLEYLGMISELDGDLAIFQQGPVSPGEKYLPCYWYEYFDEQGPYWCLMYFTRYNAGRVLELTRCEYVTPDEGFNYYLMEEQEVDLEVMKNQSYIKF